MTTTDLTANEPTIQWPESVEAALPGWHWGRHVSLGASGTGYYMIRESDGLAVIAIQRPDLGDDDAPSETDVLDAITGAARRRDEDA